MVNLKLKYYLNDILFIRSWTIMETKLNDYVKSELILLFRILPWKIIIQ